MRLVGGAEGQTLKSRLPVYIYDNEKDRYPVKKYRDIAIFV